MPQRSHNAPVAVTLDDALTAYKIIIKNAGASLHRDATDARLIKQLESLGKEGKVILTEAEAGGQPPIAAAKAAADTDKDGIPDAWEKQKGLNPKNAADANAYKLHKTYTNIEVYINALTERK